MINYPIGVSFPGTEETAKPRGITVVSAVHCDTLIKCLSPSHPQQIRFEIIPEEERSGTFPPIGRGTIFIVYTAVESVNQLPVIINAAPQPDSKVTRGSRMFPDKSIDHKGPRRLEHGHDEVTEDFVESLDEDAPSAAPSAARTRIKKRKQPMPATDSDSESRATEVVAPRVLRSKAKARVISPAISISDDESQHPAKTTGKGKGKAQPTRNPTKDAPATRKTKDAPATNTVKDAGGNTKRRQVSFQPLEALPPLKKTRCVVEGQSSLVFLLYHH